MLKGKNLWKREEWKLFIEKVSCVFFWEEAEDMINCIKVDCYYLF